MEDEPLVDVRVLVVVAPHCRRVSVPLRSAPFEMSRTRMGANCNSVGSRPQWFQSTTCHQKTLEDKGFSVSGCARCVTDGPLLGAIVYRKASGQIDGEALPDVTSL